MKDDRGAVAVIVAILMAALVGFAALGVDVAHLNSDKQQLQNGADAGALAIAQYCASGGSGCVTGNSDRLDDALDFAIRNKNYNSSIDADQVTFTGSRVTVTVSDETNLIFAGLTDPRITAKSAAEYGTYSKAATLPLTISFCELEHQGLVKIVDGEVVQIADDPTPVIFNFVGNNKDTTDNNGCPKFGPSEAMPGGFAWLVTSGGVCKASTTADDWPDADTGKSYPQYCGIADFEAMLGSTVLVPLFSEMTIPPAPRKVHLLGYAALRFEAFSFYGAKNNREVDYWTGSVPLCKNPEMCIGGRFVEFVSLADAGEFSADAPNLGATMVRLTLP